MISPPPVPACQPIRLERKLSRIMRRLGDAKGFKAWVLREAERVGARANERLKELGGRWEEGAERLKKAEEEVTRLKEKVTRVVFVFVVVVAVAVGGLSLIHI